MYAVSGKPRIKKAAGAPEQIIKQYKWVAFNEIELEHNTVLRFSH